MTNEAIRLGIEALKEEKNRRTLMTLEEAIESLEDGLEDNAYEPGCRFERAIKLGIEALKRVKGNRKYPQPTVYPLLPGEKPE